MENQSEAPAVSEAQLAARIAALKSLQPGDIIVSGDGDSTYTGVVAEARNGSVVISLVFQSYAYEGKFRSVEAASFTCVENVVARPFFRIHRTTEGVL